MKPKSAFVDLYTKVDADAVNTDFGESETALKEDIDKALSKCRLRKLKGSLKRVTCNYNIKE